MRLSFRHFIPVIPIAFCSITFISCGDSSTNKPVSGKDSASGIRSVADMIPEDRAAIKKEPVAIYIEKVKNPLNDWRFQVQLFETQKTFRFLMKLEYEEMRETDTLKIPNLGFEPKLKIIKGKEPYSCIIGFIDNKNEFREYKKVIATNNRLRVVTLKHYAVYLK
ncbi:hypothetical protein [Flavitalea sp.]|nr:hypothetical protein [Flavitalea sp.]